MPAATESFYETDKAISEYLFFHYGRAEDFLFEGLGPAEALDFAKRCAELALRHPLEKGRALDLGCAVGRSACELSALFEQTIGIDYSHGLIDAANRLLESKRVEISIADEGELTKAIEIEIPPNARPERVSFRQGDAMDLPGEIGVFDFVLMANLIDRLPDPRRCLSRIGSFLSAGGILAITSPYTWLEEYTPKKNWLGGYAVNDVPVRSFQTLQQILKAQFDLIETANLPFLIREHARKNQYSIAHASLWRKR
ncbi:putative 4-mercaptohistidine N1-methyltransferase [Pelagicoccus sp. SDUM812003]|uniref:putative 4-mercaptohistidine N1-methyltransferase n=1 Tax=Pelagicoccus sp. SDUM812003 TaxID=3041267 RepID=UPI00281081CF|nr:putative 4-mercaptohistidine N1-methyltransferase [Pelagicoccus sp. SDUM812003]MDQ8205352.1 putative 4-mercaptohistidine N1-methyltransferase [Pelagicoccus sp. SDUM812003]